MTEYADGFEKECECVSVCVCVCVRERERERTLAKEISLHGRRKPVEYGL